MIKCAVVGAKGYTGSEIIKLLAKHPEVTLTFLADKDDEIQDARDFIPSLPESLGLKIEKFSHDAVVESSDVIFLALPHTKSIAFAAKLKGENKLVIDLSADFRLKNIETYEKWYNVKHADPALVTDAVYGLPELNRDMIEKSKLIANPGCYPTGTILGLAPLLKKGLIKKEAIVIDAKTGVSGAGRNPSAATHFCEVYENFKPYKLNQHQHMPEIEEVISGVAGSSISITFVPHLLPILRGILATIYVEKNENTSASAIYQAFSDMYKDEPFVRLLKQGEFPQTKNVEGTNYCDIGVWASDSSSRVIIVTAIDNLIKGASGQAVQNMNICCGLDETMGLV